MTSNITKVTSHINPNEALIFERSQPGRIGYRLPPLLIEFWQDRPFRLHARIEFRREAAGAPWQKTRLYP